MDNKTFAKKMYDIAHQIRNICAYCGKLKNGNDEYFQCTFHSSFNGQRFCDNCVIKCKGDNPICCYSIKKYCKEHPEYNQDIVCESCHEIN